ncbi:MAG: hypothetical protein ACREF4_04160, partial [Gammaproteobacteria bacterium]
MVDHLQTQALNARQNIAVRKHAEHERRGHQKGDSPSEHHAPHAPNWGKNQADLRRGANSQCDDSIRDGLPPYRRSQAPAEPGEREDQEGDAEGEREGGCPREILDVEEACEDVSHPHDPVLPNPPAPRGLGGSSATRTSSISS